MMVFLLGMLTVSAKGMQKREDGPSPLYRVWSFLLNYHYDDFIALGDPKAQFTNLLSCAHLHPGVAEYIFTRLPPSQRYQILIHSDHVDMLVLFAAFSLNGRVILSKLMADSLLQDIVENQSSKYISMMVAKYNEVDRPDFVKRIGSKAQLKWLRGMKSRDLKLYGKYLLSDQSSINHLVKELFRKRTNSLHYLEIAPLLDDLAEYYTTQEAIYIMRSSDPLVFLARCTPKERDVLGKLFLPSDKRDLLFIKENHHFQRFPDDFFKAKKYGLLASEDEWNNFWSQMKKDVQLDERNSNEQHPISQPRQILPHPPKLQLAGADVSKIA
jgi:hypothetical protein